MKFRILFSVLILSATLANAQSTPKPIVIQGRYGSVEKIYIFKVEDTSLLTVSPATYKKLQNRPVFHYEDIQKLMEDGKYGFEAQTYVVEEIGSIEIMGSSSKAKTRAITMITGGVIGGIIGLIRHSGKNPSDCNDDFAPYTVGCYVDRGANIPFHSIGIGVGIGALLGGFFATPPIKININGQRNKFKEQQEKLREFAIFR